MATGRQPRAAAFTLVEVLVVIIIIGVLVALLLPAIQSARECARRYQCAQHLQQLITAVHNYELAYGIYPPGTLESKGPIQNHAFGYHHNWIVQLLPHFEQQNTAALIDRSVGVYHRNNAEARDLGCDILICPSQPISGGGYSSYAAVCHDNEAPIDKDNQGAFFLNSRITFDDLSDGAAQTLFIGEKIVEQGDLGWMSGTRATLRNTGLPLNTTGMAGGAIAWPRFQRNSEGNWALTDEMPEPAENQPPPRGATLPIGGFAGIHPGGCQFAFGDGRVALLDASIALDVLKQLGHRADGKLLSCNSY
jgi:prepilin-type N-terminal cleavage/methylation domain-containing protein/prepilin-type processing-associated H-X9-DG protein